MKKTLAKLILFGMMPFVVLSCEKIEENIQPKPELVTGTAFSAKYIVPLTTGRNNGETEIVDAANAAAKNVAELKPVFTEMVNKAMAGEVPVYPDGGVDKENNPKTYLKRSFGHIVNFTPRIAISDLVSSFEIEYEGEAFDGYSKMIPRYIDITFIDSKEEFPDKIMGRVFMKDLEGLKVKKGASELSLPNYLETRDFEHYVIRVNSPQDTFGIRTHADARTVQQKLEQGVLENLNPFVYP